MQYVYQNAEEQGVNKEKICTLGHSGGAWVVLGASYLQAVLLTDSDGSIPMNIKAQFLVSPDVSCYFGRNEQVAANEDSDEESEKVVEYFANFN